MKVLYFDCFAGAAGDMILGALLDAGLPLDELRRALGSLAIGGYEIGADRVLRAGIAATKFRVEEQTRGDAHEHAHHSHGGSEGASRPAHHDHRTLDEIERLIRTSALSAPAQRRACELFRRLAETEAAIHRMPVERVHLHEVGALDSIIDIVGAVFALDWVGADRILASPLNVGGGMVRSAHGLFPVPAPATVSLLRHVPVYSSGIESELVTPTGALLVTAYASGYGPVPAMTIEQVGYGAGDRDLGDVPNVLRILVGQEQGARRGDRVAFLECEIDDMNPQIYGVLMDRLYGAGALDVFYAPVQMKKNRPGTLVSIVAPPDRREPLSAILFAETTTIGLRYQEIERECLERRVVDVATPLGAVRVKLAIRDGRVVNASPEFEDCARLAAEGGVSVKDVQAQAMRAYLETS
jgi:hypothetical protein